jgi:phosphoglycerate kinase
LGKSAVEEGYLAGARTLAEQLGDKLLLPEDLLCATSPKAEEAVERSPSSIGADEMALDIGPKTQSRIQKLVANAGTALWCGTVGFQKAPAFSGGTRALLNALRETTAFTMVIGDDSVAAARALGPDTLDHIDCVAQGGPATLALLDENKLVGLEALRGTNT